MDAPGERQRLRACLHPLRLRLLEALSKVPGSSQSLARRLGESQPRVHYHLHRLKAGGLVRLVEERPKRGVIEKLYGAAPEAWAWASRLAAPPEGSRAAGFCAGLLSETSAVPPEGFLALESRTLRLTRARARHLQGEILRLLRQTQAGGEGGVAGASEYRLAFALFER